MVGQVAARAEPEVAAMGVQAVAYGAAEPRAEVGSAVELAAVEVATGAMGDLAAAAVSAVAMVAGEAATVAAVVECSPSVHPHRRWRLHRRGWARSGSASGRPRHLGGCSPVA